MYWMDRVIDTLNALTIRTYDIYLLLWYEGWPFYELADIAYYTSKQFGNFAVWLSVGFSWLLDLEISISGILNWEIIWSYILSIIPNLEAMRDWFYNWWGEITGIIDSWWLSMQVTVWDWIDIATEGLSTLIAAWNTFVGITFPSWVSEIVSLQATWDNFWSVTFPDLINVSWIGTWWTARLLDVQGLIDSALLTWLPFYNDLVSLWNSIAEFFADPEKWLYESVDRIVERFW